jgi:hypothetical protein
MAMKIHVHVDQTGRVVATTPAINLGGPKKGARGGMALVFAGPKSSERIVRVYEIDAVGDLVFEPNKGQAADFHQRLARHIKSRPDMKPLPIPSPRR